MDKQVEKELDKIRNLSNELNIQYQSMIDLCKDIEKLFDNLQQDLYKLSEELK
jgi:hypothetical protein